jgi:hypothetical protein
MERRASHIHQTTHKLVTSPTGGYAEELGLYPGSRLPRCQLKAPASTKNAEGRATRPLKQWIGRCSVLYF